jgi:hypothetical protein
MTKQEAAYHQLKRSFVLFSRERDYLSALTLAGAADEILGKLVAAAGGQKKAIDAEVVFITYIMSIHRENSSEKEIRDFLLYPRNALKHLAIGNREDLNFNFVDAAETMIDRAVSNYLALTKYWPEDQSYYEYLKERKRLNEKH